MLPQSQQVLFDWNCWDSIVRTPNLSILYRCLCTSWRFWTLQTLLVDSCLMWRQWLRFVGETCGARRQVILAIINRLLWASNRRSSCCQSWRCQPVSWCAKTLCYRSSEGGQEESRWSVCASTTSSLDEEVDDPWHFSWENKKTQAWPG